MEGSVTDNTLECKEHEETNHVDGEIVPKENQDRPVTAPAALGCSDVNTESVASSALEMMTQEAITLFRDGHQQEALDLAVQFSMTARGQLGRTHPVFVNALATVAALVDQMGGSEQAKALLLEAQDLQDEMDMEALGIDLDDDIDADDSNGEGQLRYDEMDELSTRPPTDLGKDRGGSRNRSDSRRSQHGAEESEIYSDDDDWFGFNSDVDDSPGDADVEPCSDDNGRGFDDEDDGAEAEAEAITRLTWEVNTLLQHDSPEEAAKLLSESEQILVAGGGDVGPVCKAALHTLWAAVLHTVGENEKAQCLYDEAIHVLQTEVGPGFEDTGSTSEGTSTSDDEAGQQQKDEEEEEEEAEEADKPGNIMNSSSEIEDKRKENKVEKADSENANRENHEHENEVCPTELGEVVQQETNNVSFFATEPDLQTSTKTVDVTPADVILASQRAARLRAEMGYPDNSVTKENLQVANKHDIGLAKFERIPQQTALDSHNTNWTEERKKADALISDDSEKACLVVAGCSEGSCMDSQQSQKNHEEYEPCNTTSETPEATTELAEPISPSIKTPTPPPGATPARKRPPALAPQPSYRQPAVAKSGAKATRCGGGFGGFVQQAQKPKSKAKAKAKLQKAPQENSDGVNPSQPSEAEIHLGTNEPQVNLDDTSPIQEGPTIEEAPDVADDTPFASLTPEQQKDVIERAMTCADHFLGLMKFEKAADKLEKQLTVLADDSCPHHHSPLHVDVMEKYGGVLWWDGDPEGAIDAYTAAEEILIEKPRDNWQVKRRTDIWIQAAQVCRGCGDLDSADEQLSQAIYSLTELVEKTECKNTEYADSLREAQAALGQICVEKKEYERAEEFYIAAFGSGGLDEESTRREDGETAEKGSRAESSQKH